MKQIDVVQGILQRAPARRIFRHFAQKRRMKLSHESTKLKGNDGW
jgi:hypothetical protein